MENQIILFHRYIESQICLNRMFMENKKVLKLTDFQKNEENPFMKQAIEGIENHVVKKYKSSTGSDKKAELLLLIQIQEKYSKPRLSDK